MNLLPDVDSIGNAIHVIRDQRVMLDADLARLYGVPTKRLNEQVRRNQPRFPADFVFRLEPAEWTGAMWSQIATTSRGAKSEASNRSKFATGSQGKRRDDQPPWPLPSMAA